MIHQKRVMDISQYLRRIQVWQLIITIVITTSKISTPVLFSGHGSSALNAVRESERGSRRALTDIHDGGGRHVAHGRRKEEQGVEALARVERRLWSAFVMAQQDVENQQTAELSQEHAHSLGTTWEGQFEWMDSKVSLEIQTLSSDWNALLDTEASESTFMDKVTRVPV